MTAEETFNADFSILQKKFSVVFYKLAGEHLK